MKRCWLVFVCLAVGLGTAFAELDAQPHSPWYLPQHIKVQFAGNVGVFSIAGSRFSQNKHWESDFSYGYVPKSVAGVDIHTLALKGNYYPWSWRLNDKYRLYPGYVGVGLNYTFGAQYNTIFDKKYPKTYYQFLPLQIAPLLGIRLDHGKKLTSTAVSPGVYLEVATTHMYLIHYINNPDFLSVTDIFNVALGVRIPF